MIDLSSYRDALQRAAEEAYFDMDGGPWCEVEERVCVIGEVELTICARPHRADSDEEEA